MLLLGILYYKLVSEFTAPFIQRFVGRVNNFSWILFRSIPATSFSKTDWLSWVPQLISADFQSPDRLVSRNTSSPSVYAQARQLRLPCCLTLNGDSAATFISSNT